MKNIEADEKEFIIHYHQNVVIPFSDYKKIAEDCPYGRGANLRAATNLAKELFHLREYLPDRLALTRAEAEVLCADFGLLGDVANCLKHKELKGKNTPHGAPLVKKSKDILELHTLIEYNDDAGQYTAALTVIKTRLVNNTSRLLLDVMTNVINFWESYLHDKGVLSSARKFKFIDPYRFRTRAEAHVPNHELSAGAPMNIKFQFLKYDNETGKVISKKAEKITYTVRKPHALTLTATIKCKDGRAFETDLPLSLEESNRYMSLKTELQRNNYLILLAADKKVFKEHGILMEVTASTLADASAITANNLPPL
jgi:hypothetical protein